MSRFLETSLIFLCWTCSLYTVLCACNELWDLIWKVNRQ